MKCQVTKSFTFDAAHRLVNHPGLCKNLHGHTYRLDVTIEGEVDRTGLVIDFADLKSLVKTTIIDKVDHATIVDWEDYTLREFLQKNEMRLFIMPRVRPTAEEMVLLFTDILLNNLPTKYKLAKLRLYETPTSYAEVSL